MKGGGEQHGADFKKLNPMEQVGKNIFFMIIIEWLMIIESLFTFIRSQGTKDIVLWRFHALRLTAWYWLSLWQSWSTLRIGEWSIHQAVFTNPTTLAKAKLPQPNETSLYNCCIPQFPWCWHHAKRSQNQGQGPTGRKVFSTNINFSNRITPLSPLW